MSQSRKQSGLPPLDWLRVFEAAGRHGNFTAAAQEQGATQAAVSQRIRNLESWLGRPLFSRGARGVTLTVDGESYLPLVQETLRTLEQGTVDLFGKSPREIRLAALSSHLDTLVLPRVVPFLAAYPDLRFVTNSVPLRSAFADESTALQLRYGRGPWPGRQAHLLHPEVLQPMMPTHWDPDDWKLRPAIELRGERPGWQEWARALNLPVPHFSGLNVDSMGHALRAARLGQGIVLGSRVLARHFLATDQLTLIDVPPLPCAEGYWLTWPDSFSASRRRRKLLEELIAALSQP
ncbi:LysR family transcriptional regulator [Aliisedimentitalea scapharcae]|uniref:LysR family transcriptional regulator n=1 Tax=Aliisedimentitalea scapharcae TaxID=1524259 RepID=A0ABZ2XTW1_9RHOB